MNQADGERDIFAHLLKPEVFRMQVRLYGPDTHRSHPVSDAVLWIRLRELRAASLLDPFRIWLVGSRVEPCRNTSDIDLVLSPRIGVSLSDQAIDDALWFCRNYPLYEANPSCIVDPCFRHGGPTIDVAALAPDTVRTTAKLFSPQIMFEVLAGRIREYRRLGGYSIEYLRRAGETSYYRKLPRRSFGNLLSPYLRPAVEVL
jgi:hypothetical protein